ncbi:MAG: PilN domain-containing protein [Candidatus Methylomirabilia bacterium]
MIGSVRLGLALRDSAIGLVAIKGRRLIHAFTLEAQEDPAAALQAELESRRIRSRKVRVGISRNLTVVKTLDLPPVAGGSLAQMVGFELERHIPFPAEEACFDFARLTGPKAGPLKALVVAAERRIVDGTLRLLEQSRLRALSLGVAAHDLTALLGRWSRSDRAAWVHRAGDEVTLLLLEGRAIRLSRSLPWTGAETLAEEVQKTLRFVRWEEIAELWVSGDESLALEASPALAALGEVMPPPFSPAASRLIDELGEAGSGLMLLALGVALGPRRPVMTLLPESLRPRQLTLGQLTTAATLTATALLGLSAVFAQGHQDRRYLDQLNQAIRALDPELRVVERLSAELQQKRRLLATVKALEESGLEPLPLLRELTQAIPPDAWLTNLSLGADGVDLTGQAAAASQLIPLLENSARLEQVEFASPVTKRQDKERFRIRARWQTPPTPARPRSPRQSPGRQVSP